MLILILSLEGKKELADKYLDLFSEKSTIAKSNVQKWIPIVAASQLENASKEEQEVLNKWINVVEYM